MVKVSCLHLTIRSMVDIITVTGSKAKVIRGLRTFGVCGNGGHMPVNVTQPVLWGEKKALCSICLVP